MYAILEILGQQFKVTENQKIYIHRLKEEKGSSISFNSVLFVDKNGSPTIGNPSVKGVSIKATVLDHLKGDKVIVFKKKRRKGYKRKNGHRQSLTQIQIDSINTEN